MNTGFKIGLGMLVLMAVGCVAVVSTGISVYNNCVNQESGLTAQYKQDQNNYDSLYKKVTETAGVTDKYAQDFKSAFDVAMKDRYGEKGSQAMFQMLKEQNPQLDVAVYKQLQQVIEAGRESFAAEQKTLLDKKRTYENILNQVPSGLFAKVIGFPKIDLTKYDIITSDRTEKAFQDKKDEPFNVGVKKQ
jgi:hypothetical protein